MYAGQIAGVEAAVYAVRSSFDLDDTEGVLLVDASNAFNSLNCPVALQNIRQLCPSFPPILINTYRSAAALYTGGDLLFSEEGTTQGDPLAMPMYSLATASCIGYSYNSKENACTNKTFSSTSTRFNLCRD